MGMPSNKSEAQSCRGGISGSAAPKRWATPLQNHPGWGCPWLFPPVRGGEWIWLCPEAAACSFRCTIPRKSQEVIKWKRSENEEVLVPQPLAAWDGAAMPWLGCVPGVSPLLQGIPDLFQGAGSASAKCLQVGLVPRRFLTSWVKWHMCRVAVVVSGTAKCRDHTDAFFKSKESKLTYSCWFFYQSKIPPPLSDVCSKYWVHQYCSLPLVLKKYIYIPPTLHFHYIFAPFWCFFSRYQRQFIQLNYFAASFSQGGRHGTHCVLWHYRSQIGQEMKDCQNVTVYFLAWKHACLKYDM